MRVGLVPTVATVASASLHKFPAAAVNDLIANVEMQVAALAISKNLVEAFEPSMQIEASASELELFTGDAVSDFARGFSRSLEEDLPGIDRCVSVTTNVVEKIMDSVQALMDDRTLENLIKVAVELSGLTRDVPKVLAKCDPKKNADGFEKLAQLVSYIQAHPTQGALLIVKNLMTNRGDLQELLGALRQDWVDDKFESGKHVGEMVHLIYFSSEIPTESTLAMLNAVDPELVTEFTRGFGRALEKDVPGIDKCLSSTSAVLENLVESINAVIEDHSIENILKVALSLVSLQRDVPKALEKCNPAKNEKGFKKLVELLEYLQTDKVGGILFLAGNITSNREKIMDLTAAVKTNWLEEMYDSGNAAGSIVKIALFAKPLPAPKEGQLTLAAGAQFDPELVTDFTRGFGRALERDIPGIDKCLSTTSTVIENVVEAINAVIEDHSVENILKVALSLISLQRDLPKVLEKCDPSKNEKGFKKLAELLAFIEEDKVGGAMHLFSNISGNMDKIQEHIASVSENWIQDMYEAGDAAGSIMKIALFANPLPAPKAIEDAYAASLVDPELMTEFTRGFGRALERDVPGIDKCLSSTSSVLENVVESINAVIEDHSIENILKVALSLVSLQRDVPKALEKCNPAKNEKGFKKLVELLNYIEQDTLGGLLFLADNITSNRQKVESYVTDVTTNWVEDMYESGNAAGSIIKIALFAKPLPAPKLTVEGVMTLEFIAEQAAEIVEAMDAEAEEQQVVLRF